MARRLDLRRRRGAFFKRAQIAAADLALAGIAPADDLGELTLFADNLVPHVLRVDGVLESTPSSSRGSRPSSCWSTTPPRRSSSAPVRCTQSSCSSPPTGRPPPRRSTTRSGTVAGAPLQGDSAPPGTHDRLLIQPGFRLDPRQRRPRRPGGQPPGREACVRLARLPASPPRRRRHGRAPSPSADRRSQSPRAARRS